MGSDTRAAAVTRDSKPDATQLTTAGIRVEQARFALDEKLAAAQLAEREAITAQEDLDFARRQFVELAETLIGEAIVMDDTGKRER